MLPTLIEVLELVDEHAIAWWNVCYGDSNPNAPQTKRIALDSTQALKDAIDQLVMSRVEKRT
jgi:hypothetical protein